MKHFVNQAVAIATALSQMFELAWWTPARRRVLNLLILLFVLTELGVMWTVAAHRRGYFKPVQLETSGQEASLKAVTVVPASAKEETIKPQPKVEANPPKESQPIEIKEVDGVVPVVDSEVEEEVQPMIEDPRTQTRRRLAKRELNSLADALGEEAVLASDEIIDEIEGRKNPDSISLAQEIGLSAKQARELQRKESILRRELQRADANGATYFRRMLLSDYYSWARNYLGMRKYEMYRELAPPL